MSPRSSAPGSAARPRLPPFRYKHAGDLATIGKRRAVIDFGWIKLKGALAWWLWGFAHIYFLIGVRNRLSVALNWLWIYARDQRGARLITWWGGEVEGTAPFPREEQADQNGARPDAEAPHRLPKSGVMVVKEGWRGMVDKCGRGRSKGEFLPSSSGR